MLKKYSIVNFVLLVIIAILGVLLSVCPFNVPASTDRYNGFIGAIQKGIDLGGGVSAIYQAENSGNSSDNLQDLIDESLSKLESGIDRNTTYTEFYVTRQGENKIRLEISDALDTDSLFTYLEDGKQIFITNEEASDTVTNPTVYITSEDIQTAYIGYDYENSNYTIILNFTSQGREHLQELLHASEDSGRTNSYVYLDEVNSDNLLSTVAIDTITGNTFTLTSSNSTDYSSTDSNQTMMLVCSIISGSLGYDISLLEASYISPVLGQNTLLYIGISFLIFIVLTLLYLIIKYKHLGLLGSLALVFYLVLFVFFMQAIPFIILNLSAVFGCIFAFVIAVISNIIIFEKIKSEYALGKKIHLSFKSGIKKSLWPILDSHIIIILASSMIWIFAPSALKGFAIALILGTLLSAFTSLVITRYLLNIYLPLNSTKAKRLGLYRDKKLTKIEEVSPENNTTQVASQVTETVVEGGNDHE